MYIIYMCSEEPWRRCSVGLYIFLKKWLGSSLKDQVRATGSRRTKTGPKESVDLFEEKCSVLQTSPCHKWKRILFGYGLYTSFSKRQAYGHARGLPHWCRTCRADRKRLLLHRCGGPFHGSDDEQMMQVRWCDSNNNICQLHWATSKKVS